MIDYSRIVDDLRSAVMSASPDWADFLRSAAADYSVACETVNERLRKCGEYLRKGLRSEAIQQAEIDPKLLDCVATLDFSEREQCNRTLQQYGIRTPAPLLLELATELNEAYAIEQPIASLLKQHRQLALAHAPLKSRVAVLQQIAAADPNNTVWQDDLIEFEQARMKEIQREVQQAAQQDNFAYVSSLCQELKEQPWQESPPQALVQQVEAHRNRLYQQMGREELARVAELLHAAYSSFDLDRAKEASIRWQQVAADLDLSHADPLYEDVNPALQWIADEEARLQEDVDYQAAVTMLERALDRGANAPQLEQAYSNVERYQRGISEFLERRYREHLVKHELRESRKRKIILTTTAAGVLIAVVASAIGVYSWTLSRRTANHAAQMAELLSKDRLDEAQSYLKKLTKESPHIARSPEIERHALVLKDRLRKESERRQAFENDLAAAKAEIDARHPVPERLEQLQKQAVQSSERRRVQQLRREQDALVLGLQGERDRAADQRISAVTTKVEALDAEGAEGVVALQAQLREIRAEISFIEETYRDISAAVHARLAAAKSRLGAFELRLRNREEQESNLARITRRIGDRNAFVAALTTYVQQDPESTRTLDFKRAIGEAEYWPAVDEWNKLVELWNRSPITELSTEAARERIDRTTAYLDKYAPLESASPVELRLPCLRAIVTREEGGSSIANGLRQLWGDRLLNGLWQFTHKDGRIFFGETEPKTMPGKTIGYYYLVDFSFNTRNVALQEGDIREKRIAPQCQLSGKVVELLDRLTDKNWEPTFWKMLNEIENADGVDPILKLGLLQRTCQVGRQGSLVFEKAFSTYGRRLEANKNLANVEWMNPATDGLAESRETAEKIITSLPELSGLARQIKTDLTELRTPIGKKFTWIGWLRRSGKQQWTASIPQLPDNTGTLCVLAGPAPLRMITVGTLTDGLPGIQSADPQALIEGRPLFFVARSSTNPVKPD